MAGFLDERAPAGRFEPAEERYRNDRRGGGVAVAGDERDVAVLGVVEQLGEPGAGLAHAGVARLHAT